jgi:hypothetical protein
MSTSQQGTAYTPTEVCGQHVILHPSLLQTTSTTVTCPRTVAVDGPAAGGNNNKPPSRLVRSSPSDVIDGHTSTASPNLDKLDPVSRAVYENFIGKLSATTTGPKSKSSSSGKRRGHQLSAAVNSNH